MNWSALLAGLVTAWPTTVTSTVPVPAGASQVIWVSDSTLTLVAGVPPKLTAVALVKPEPLMVTDVPPAPPEGLMLDTVVEVPRSSQG